MARVRLIHWRKSEAVERAAYLRNLGHTVSSLQLIAPTLIRELNHEMPDALVIDLSRLPSQGRSVGILARQSKQRAQIALVFVDGLPAKVDAIRKVLPDALYCTWDSIGEALQQLQPPLDPVKPKPMAEYTRGVARKLGLKNTMTVALIGAPEGFLESLSGLPEDLQVVEEPSAKCDLLLWFPRGCGDFEESLNWISTRQKTPRLWIVWPKQASRVRSDLTQPWIRKTAAMVGLVDYRVCSVDETWSALLFTTKKE